ncbi:MAG: hypothetical protein OXK72_03860 [Gammaproteobacteria bacterium]|nr:hypothetical protein [Gammaproteobacteria bacterium]
MQKPNISSAIPKQRYRLGAYTIVVLGEIESEDQVEYEYLLAAVQDGHSEPEIYITCERFMDRQEGVQHAVRVFATQLGPEESGKIIDQSSKWASQDAFVAFALLGFQQMLQLHDEQPVPVT